MEKYFNVTVEQVYGGMTPEELANELKKLDDDYFIDWSVEKDSKLDDDGCEEFNGKYNLRVKAVLYSETPEHIVETARRAYYLLINGEF